MKIAMMTNNYLPFIGGVPISIQRLSDGLRREGHKVTIFAPTYKEQLRDHNIMRYHSLIKGIVNGASVPDSFDRRIEREFVKGDFDVIHVHHPMMIGWTAVYLSRKYHVPLVLTYHTRYEQYLHYIKASCFQSAVPLYMRNYMRFCDMVFAPTPLMQEYLYQIGCEAPVHVLPTGISDDSFRADEDIASALRRRFLGEGINNRKYLFCTVARLAKEKNLEFLFHVLAARKEAGNESDFCLVLVGEGPEEKHLRKLAARHDLEREIYFAGRVSNEQIKNYCRASDLFLFSSLSETQGIVLLEAMAVGTPVLAVRATGVSDIIVNGVNGLMTDVSETEFGETLDQVLKGSRRQLEQGAVDTARKYRVQDIARCAADYYKSAIAAYEYTDTGITENFLLHKISGIL
ncbi:MAG: glycosyltransferase [Lachnospiraceae bacterium]|nr:glycosyltransferase [Lachnospiraceae bacterium]MDE7202097.1 glycosyltransferase [Lachnospiraceae bacterium]